MYGRASAPFVGNCHSISSMRFPGEFAPDRYVELNISATTVIVNIKIMLDICGASYEDVKITYTKGNKDEKESLLKAQSIRTVFSRMAFASHRKLRERNLQLLIKILQAGTSQTI